MSDRCCRCLRGPPARGTLDFLSFSSNYARAQLLRPNGNARRKLRAAARRRRTLRDALLTGEDRGQLAKISCLDGQLYRGVVEAVGADHVVLRDGDVERSVALAHIVALDLD